MANKTSQKKIDQFLADYESSRKNGGADKASADKGKSQYQTSQDKISGYMNEYEGVLRNSPSRQQMIALERKATEEAARKKAQLQANVQQALRDQAIDSVESQALAAIKQRLNQGLGEFRQTDLQQGPFSGYQDPVELALQAQDLKGVGPQKTWRAEALKLGQQAVEQRRQEYAQQGSVKDYAERFKQKQTVVPDEKERTENVYKYVQVVPYMDDFEEISSKEGANTKRKRTEEEAKKYEDERNWAEVNGSSMALAMRNQEQDLIDKYVSDQQLKVYNYLVNSGQQEYADEYWRGVKSYAQAARNADDIKFTRDALAKLPEGFARDAVGSAMSVALNMMNAVTSTYYIAEQEIREALTGERQELDPQDMAFQAGRERDALRQDVSEKLPGWGKFLYDTGISMADTVAMGALLGPTGGALLMGSGAAVDTVRDVKERGGSDQQALTMGLIAGGAELLTEKLGFKRLEKMIGGSRGNVFREILGAMASEAGEEGVTEIANILTDVLVMGDKSEYDALVRQYMAQGMSEDGACRQAFKDLAVQVGLAALGGGLMGGVMGGGAAVVGTVARAAEQKAQRNAWREAVDYDAAPNIFTEGVRGGSTYENMRQLAEQAYDRQQETANQSSAALASLGKGEADVLPASRTVSPTIERMAQEYGEDASVFKSNYNGSDPAQYKRGFDAMFKAGQSGLPLEMLGGVSDQLTAGMSEATKQAIYTAGRNKAAQTITPGAKNLTTKKLTSEQRTFLRVWDAIGKEYGFEVDLVDDVTGANGAYRSGGRRIVVSANAVENAYTQAAGHETVHYLKSVNPEGYQVLEDTVLKYLTDEDSMFDLETAIRERMAEYAGKNLTREKAIEEIVAEALPTFFGDKEAVRAFVRENRTLAEKIRDFFVEFANKVREIAERYMVSQDRAEITELLGNTEALKEIAQTFDLALREAQEKPAGKADGEVVTSRNESKRNRAIPEGSMKNKFYGALTRQEWAGYFETLKRPEYDADLYDDGQRAYMVRGGKLVLMEMQDTGEFSVVDVYSGVTEWYNDDIRNILGEWEEGRYDERDIRAWFETIAVNAGSKVLQAYDRHSGRFVPVVGKQNGAGRGAAGVSGGRDAHGAGVREDAVGQDQGDGTVTDAGLGASDDGEVAFSLKKTTYPTSTEAKDAAEANRAQTQTEAFKEWFDGSVVVNEDGSPKIMYHGTSRSGFNYFRTQEGRYGLMGMGAYFTDNPEVAQGYTRKGRGTTPGVYPVYLNIKNPIDMDAKAGGLAAKWQEFFGEELDGRQLDGDMTNEEILRIVEEALMDAEVPDYEAYDYFSQFYEDNGIDGITHMGGGRLGNGPRHRVYIALSGYQVKSATGNEGTFDPDNADVRYSLKSEEKKAVRETQDEDWQRIQSGDVTVPDIKVDNDTVRRQAAGALNKGLRDKLNQQIGMAANRILRDTESKYGRNELKEKLTELVKQYAANGYDTHTALMAEALANQIIDQSTHKVQSEAAEVYQEARRQLRNAHISLTETQRQEVANEYGSVDAYRKAVFDTVNVRNEGVTLESLWDELSGNHPEIFPPDTGEAQMPGVIAQFDQLMRPRYENIYGMDAEAAAHDLAMRIQGDVLGMIGAKNAAHDLYGTADKFRKQIRAEYDAEIMARQKQRVAEFQRIAGELRAAKDKGDAEARKKIMAEYRKALKKVDVNTAIAEVRATEKVRYQQQTENRERAQLRDKITKRANELANMLIKPQKGKRVPTKLQGRVIDVLGALDVNGQRAAEQGTETQRSAQFREKLTGIKNFYAQVWDSQSKGESPEGLDGLMMTISERNMAEMAETLEVLGSCETFYLRDMDSKQLKSLDALLKNVKHTVESIGKLWRIKRYESIIQLGDASIAEMDSRGPQKITNSTVGGARDFFVLDNMEPVSYGERLGEAGSEVIQSLMDGEKIKFGKIREASEATEKMLKEVGISGYDIGKWRKHVQVVTLGGMNVRMTDAMLMGLYLTAKRPQGRQHLLANGMRIPTTDRTGGQVKKILLSEADLTYAAGLLSDKQRQLADRMGEYLSTAVAKWGNDVTQRLYLYDAFTEKNYWPITSDPNVLKTQEPEGERAFNAIINAGFTKPVNQKATNAVIVMDAFDVFGNHIGEMASYAGYAEALTDALAWLNYKQRNSETRLVEGSVKESMERLLGNGGIQYLTNLVQDINGARHGGDNMQLNKLLGNYKKAAVMGKIRVAIQQPTSIVRAAAEINPWHLIKGLRPTKGLPKGKSIGEWLRSNGTIEEMQKWSNLAWWKSNGNYDIGIGKGTDAILWGDTSVKDTVMEKIATQGGLVDPGKMDDLTWAHMWLAVKSEIKRKRKDLEVGSDEYFRAVAERFEYVMDRTQVVDTVMHRSALMRGKDGLVKSLTSFMSEPTKSYNMLMRAVMEVGRHPKDGAAHKRLARTTLAYVASAAATAAATALYDAIRYRDDEEKTLDYLIKGEFGKDWAEQWLRGFMSNANLLDNIPGVSTAIGALKGEEATIMGFDTFTDIKTAYDKLMNYFLGGNTKKLTVYGAVSPAVKAASEVFGLPFAGIMTNVETLGRIFDPKWAQSKSVMATQEKAFAELYKAMASGDSKKALEIRTQMAKGMYGNQPKSPKEIDTGIYKELARQDERVMRAYEMKLAGNQSKELVALRKAIMADGFTEAQVNGAINYCETLTDTEVEEKDMEAELEAKLYSTTDLFSAVRNGDADDVAAVADYLESVSNASDPEKSIRSSVSGEFREEYVDLVKSGQNGKARALAGKLAMVGIDQEYLDGWMKDSYKADMKQHVSDGRVQKALEAIDELKEYGMDVSGIVSSLNSEFKERYVELVNSGRRTEADRLGRTLQELDLYWKDGTTNYFRDEKLEEWLEED